MEEGCTEQAAPCRIEHAGLRAKEPVLIEEEENLSLCPGKWTARSPPLFEVVGPRTPKADSVSQMSTLHPSPL